MPVERETGEEWLMSHKLSWVAASLTRVRCGGKARGCGRKPYPGRDVIGTNREPGDLDAKNFACSAVRTAVALPSQR